MTDIKEKPILFSGPMVRAILDGGKTMTRRVVKHQDCAVINQRPYKPGDRLWVRETWKLWEDPDDRHDWVLYRAGGKMSFPNIQYLAMPNDPFADKWRPSIFMPRWASRITLEVVSVRVERLQEITHKDALLEGVSYDVSKEDGAPLARFRKLWDSINGKKCPWSSNPLVWVVEFRRVL